MKACLYICIITGSSPPFLFAFNASLRAVHVSERTPRMFSVRASFHPATILAHVKRSSSNLYERVIVSGLRTARCPFGGGEQRRGAGRDEGGSDLGRSKCSCFLKLTSLH